MSTAEEPKVTMAEAKMAFELSAITPLDGRYKSRVAELSDYFSECSYMKYRCQTEIEYFLALTESLPQLASFPKERADEFRAVYKTFGAAEATRVKAWEKITRHDVKAVEYFLKEEYDTLKFPEPCKEFIHFALTSEDVNSTARPLALKQCLEKTYLPKLNNIREALMEKVTMWDGIPMLAKTHGQSATPTRLGKEIMVFVERLDNELENLKAIKHRGKFGGATGAMNAHFVAYPEVDWRAFATKFLSEGLGLVREQHTTQLQHYDSMAAIFHSMARIDTILIDLSRDMWQYISMDYFKLAVVKGEIGSSAMPHKVNPIDFENAEGNFGIANALFGFLAAKLPISRLQRDLSDSTVSRTIGMTVGHAVAGIWALQLGLSKITVNEAALAADLDDNWAVVAEAIQTILRREGYPKPYEALKELTRTGEKVTEATIKDFITKLDVSAVVKAEMAVISPHTFTGIPL